MPDYSKYFILLAQQEAQQARAEVQLIRNSLRYKAGNLLVGVFPPSRRSLWALKQLFLLFKEHHRAGSSRIYQTQNHNFAEALKFSHWILVTPDSTNKAESQENTWITPSSTQLAEAMDITTKPGKITLRSVDQVILRRLARWQALGGTIEWDPASDVTHSEKQIAYLKSLLKLPLEFRL